MSTLDAAFFYECAGWSYDPAKETAEEGRRRCSEELARAYAALQERIDAGTARVLWEEDDISAEDARGDIPLDEWLESVERFGLLGCVVEVWDPSPGKGWTHAASLWSIVGDDNYHRVVEAELADEALALEASHA